MLGIVAFTEAASPAYNIFLNEDFLDDCFNNIINFCTIFPIDFSMKNLKLKVQNVYIMKSRTENQQFCKNQKTLQDSEWSHLNSEMW